VGSDPTLILSRRKRNRDSEDSQLTAVCSIAGNLDAVEEKCLFMPIKYQRVSVSTDSPIRPSASFISWPEWLEPFTLDADATAYRVELEKIAECKQEPCEYADQATSGSLRKDGMFNFWMKKEREEDGTFRKLTKEGV
jgi:hypothetical protein